MRVGHSPDMCMFSFVLILTSELLAQLTIHEMGIKILRYPSAEARKLHWGGVVNLVSPTIVTSLIHVHIVRVSLQIFGVFRRGFHHLNQSGFVLVV